MAPGKDDMQILEAFHMFQTGENSQKKKKNVSSRRAGVLLFESPEPGTAPGK